MNTYNADNHVKNLPDCYKKTADSNNAKILEIEKNEMTKIRTTLNQVEDILTLSKATGKTLDMYGMRVGQPRGLTSDDQYRMLILAKIMRNLSNGSIPSIIDCLSKTFSCEKSDIQLTESATECKIDIASLPLSVINKAGFTTSQVTAIIKSLLPVGLTVESLIYEGTFEFASGEGETDNDKGFCDVEGGTIGGYLGYLQGDENEPILPI